MKKESTLGNGQRTETSKGLEFRRYYTREGISPFDAVEWEYRTAAITSESGEVIFEQKNVEVPKGWSMTTTNIVATPPQRQVHDAVERSRFCAPVLHERHHARRVPHARGQDGCRGSTGHECRWLPRRHAELAHRSVQRPGHLADLRREHRAQCAARRQARAGAEGR